MMRWAQIQRTRHEHGFTVACGSAFKMAAMALLVVLGACGGDGSRSLSGSSEFDLPSTTFGSPNPAASFGSAVAALGEFIAVGEPSAGADGPNGPGVVHVYREGALVYTLRSPAPNAQGRFGAALMAAGETDLYVGAPGERRVYRVDTSTRRITIAFEGDYASFGSALAAVGQEIWIGAPSFDRASGVVFRYVGTTGDLLGSIRSPAAEPGGQFGSALSYVTTGVVIGAPGEANGGGRAYLVDAARGTILESLASPDEVPGGAFGTSVAPAASGFVVGAPREDGGSGRAYVFRGSSAVLEHTLSRPASGASGGSFGTVVASADNHVLVGAIGAVGTIHVFDAPSGRFERTIETESGRTLDLSIATQDGIALIGVLQAAGPGLAQANRCSSGTLEYLVQSPTAEQFGNFGGAVALIGNFMVVGARGETNDDGQVHVYNRQGVFQRTIVAPIPGFGGSFGSSLAGHGTTQVIVGAPFDDVTTGGTEGSAYLFDLTDGSLLRTFVSPNFEQFGAFGTSVASDGTQVFVGAPREDVPLVLAGVTTVNAGRVYAFDGATGTLNLTILSNAQEAFAEFGRALHVDAGELFVGEPFNSAGGSVFRNSTSTGLFQVEYQSDVQNSTMGESITTVNGEVWIGDPNFDINGQTMSFFLAGAVKVFDRATAQIQATLVSADAKDGGFFGRTLDEDDGIVAIGAPGEFETPAPPQTMARLAGKFPPGNGLVHLYDSGSRFRMQRFQSNNPEQDGDFGRAVAFDQGLLMAGAPGEVAGVTNRAGRVYAFVPGNVQSFFTGAAEAGGFGENLDASGAAQTIIIGAPFEDTASGNAYIIDLLDPSGLTALSRTVDTGGRFGDSVLAQDSGFVVAAIGDAAGAGRLHLYDRDGNFQTNIDNPGTHANFGSALLDVDGDIIVSAVDPGQLSGPPSSGVAYFMTTAGSILQTFTPSVVQAGDEFGSVLALTNAATVLIAAPGFNNDDGRVYEFSLVTGAEVRIIDPPTSGQGGRFGTALERFRDGFLVGEPFVSGSRGVVHFFSPTGIITISNPATESFFFGVSISADDQNILVGATASTEGGLVYLVDEAGTILRTFRSPNPDPNGNFGGDVLLENGGILIGAFFEDVNPQDAGRAYLFGTIGEEDIDDDIVVELESPSPVVGGLFGHAVALAGLDVLVGEPGAANGGGRLHIMDGVTGMADTTIASPNNIAGGMFGYSLGSNPVMTIVGAPGETGGATNSGRAYLVNSLNGEIRLSFQSLNPSASGMFGYSGAVASANIVVGAPGEFNAQGAAYYFDCVVEQVLQTFLSPTPAGEGRFGEAVAARGTVAFVGAPGEDNGDGQVHLFNGLTGTLIRSFTSPAGGEFGATLKVFGPNILVAAPQASVALELAGTEMISAGQVYLINAVTGAVILTFDTPNPTGGGQFGAALASNGIQIGIGAPGEDNGQGRVYIFDGITGDLLDTIEDVPEEAGAAFGAALDFLGSNGVAGAPNQTVDGTSDAGRAYLNPQAVPTGAG